MLTVNLEDAVFTSGIFEVPLADGSTLYFYQFEEVMKSDGIESVVNDILIYRRDIDDNETLYSSVIGFDNTLFTITTEYEGLEGSVLTESNRYYCKVEINE